MFETDKIKKKMKRLGITQAELAKECGVSYQAINMLLNLTTEYLYQRFVVFRKSIDTAKK